MAGLIVGSLIIAGATVGSSAYQAREEKKQQKKLLEFQEGQVRRAEERVATAERMAIEEAAARLRKKRLAQTRTVLTTPLGVQEEAITGRKMLLGG